MRARVLHLGLFFGAAFALVGGRLFQLQVLRADLYRELADRARSWDELTASYRGRVVDRKGRTLACDVPSLDLSVVPANLGVDLRGETWKEELRGVEFLPALARALGVEKNGLAPRLEAAVGRARRWRETSRPHVFFRGVEKETWLAIRLLSEPSYETAVLDSLPRRARARKREELIRRSRFPGIVCSTSLRRSYPQGRTGCHIVGYVQLYGEGEVESLRRWGLLPRGAPSQAELLRTIAFSADAGTLVESVLGLGEEELTPPLLAARVRELPEGKRGAFERAFGRWVASTPKVALTEGEHIWVESKKHLKDMRIGRRGVEAVENESLRGKHGFRVLMLQPGRRTDYLREELPQPGSTLALTIDVDLQRAMERALEKPGAGTMGAGVAVDVGTGEILALASSPGFDPNWFVTPGSEDVSRALNDKVRRPLFNRAIQGLYPPASVFKVVVAAGALAQGTISPEMCCGCSGLIERGRGRFRCEGVHGEVAVERAVVVSCNVFFYLAGETLGADALASWAREFGFGSRTGVELAGEKEGTVPDPSWKRATRGEKWLSPTETYHFAIGQGYLSVTPLQVACMMCAFANGGRFPRPRVLQHTPERWRRLPLAPDALDLVRAAMRGVVNDPGGTAYRAFHGEGGFAEEFPAVAVAGKTGSAEHSTREPTHSWFAGYAPADSPEVAFAVIVERGGGGGGAAAEAAAGFLSACFKEEGN